MPRASEPDRSPPSLRQLLTDVLSIQQLYVLSAAVLVLANARQFYGALKAQTEQVVLWFEPERFAELASGTAGAPWSAPLDDVFIHFDFARATAQGHPFEWIAGNGYSSGGTSMLYPFVLAAGYLAGYTGLRLMHWAAIVACVGTFAWILGVQRLFKNLPPASALVAPPLLLSVGALNWTLYSGMEVAMFLGLWALCVVLWDDLMTHIESASATRLRALWLGLACALLVAGRPEAAPLVALFGLWCGLSLLRRGRRLAALEVVALVGTFGAVIVIGQMVANHILTGSSSAAGALAKLEMHHPYMTDEQVYKSWWFFLKYQLVRLSGHHFGGAIWGIHGSGYLVWPLALLSLAFDSTRRYGTLLLISAAFWICLVALNGQVRWQNERYTMPAVAWLLAAASLGVGGALSWAWQRRPELSGGRLRKWGVTGALVATLSLYVAGQAPRFEDQVWFFGRASRNILEQHVRAASAMKKAHPPLDRILLSDAGAIPYVSQLPAFDLIGLGGYGRLPIAGASRQGVGAAIELLEYLPVSDLPDVMALYPSWWGDFILWFGRRVDEFPVRGNVICGGASKVIYSPRWAPLLHSGEPLELAEHERLVDVVDVADVLSEKAHRVSWERPEQGYVGMKMLPDARNESADLWDAGRLLSPNQKLFFELSGFRSQRAELLVRIAPARPVELTLQDASGREERLKVEAADHWQEVRFPLEVGPGPRRYSLHPTQENVHVYHLFAVEPATTSGPRTTAVMPPTPQTADPATARPDEGAADAPKPASAASVP